MEGYDRPLSSAGSGSSPYAPAPYPPPLPTPSPTPSPTPAEPPRRSAGGQLAWAIINTVFGALFVTPILAIVYSAQARRAESAAENRKKWRTALILNIVSCVLILAAHTAFWVWAFSLPDETPSVSDPAAVAGASGSLTDALLEGIEAGQAAAANAPVRGRLSEEDFYVYDLDFEVVGKLDDDARQGMDIYGGAALQTRRELTCGDSYEDLRAVYDEAWEDVRFDHSVPGSSIEVLLSDGKFVLLVTGGESVETIHIATVDFYNRWTFLRNALCNRIFLDDIWTRMTTDEWEAWFSKRLTDDQQKTAYRARSYVVERFDTLGNADAVDILSLDVMGFPERPDWLSRNDIKQLTGMYYLFYQLYDFGCDVEIPDEYRIDPAAPPTPGAEEPLPDAEEEPFPVGDGAGLV